MTTTQAQRDLVAAFNPAKFGYYIDEAGNQLPASWNLGERINAIAEWLGLNFNQDGTIKQVEQINTYPFLDNGSVNIPEEGYPVGQVGIAQNQTNLETYFASIYRKRGFKFDSTQVNKDSNLITEPEKALRRGDFNGIHNLLQYLECLLDDFNKILNSGDAAAWVLPNANPNYFEDGEGNKIETFAKGEGIMTAIAECLYNQSTFSRQLTELEQSVLQIKAELRETVKQIGGAVSYKQIPYEIDGQKGYGLPFVGKPDDSPSITDLLFSLLSSVGILVGNQIQDVPTAFDNEREKEKQGNIQSIFPPRDPNDNRKSYIVFEDGTEVVIEYWNP